jgi:hypothetical protein
MSFCSFFIIKRKVKWGIKSHLCKFISTLQFSGENPETNRFRNGKIQATKANIHYPNYQPQPNQPNTSLSAQTTTNSNILNRQFRGTWSSSSTTSTNQHPIPPKLLSANIQSIFCQLSRLHINTSIHLLFYCTRCANCFTLDLLLGNQQLWSGMD